MNSFVYLCPVCSKKLDLSGFDVVNKVGRKWCELCGSSEDHLVVVNRQDFDRENAKVPEPMLSKVMSEALKPLEDKPVEKAVVTSPYDLNGDYMGVTDTRVIEHIKQLQSDLDEAREEVERLKGLLSFIAEWVKDVVADRINREEGENG
jgi:hypothetical protein